jgi:hypothetical protein
MRIEKANWFAKVFGKSFGFADLLREPELRFAQLSIPEQNKLRQTQIFEGEVIRVLGHASSSEQALPGDFSLVMKFDDVIGWLPRNSYQIDSQISEFVRPHFASMKPLEFLGDWKGTLYLWGGLSKKGIDCSGLTQFYFLSVHEKLIPKNSHDQRKFGAPKRLEQIQNEDLIFGRKPVERGGSGVHHVGLFLDGNVWHARTEGGVVCESFDSFTSEFDVEAVIQINL